MQQPYLSTSSAILCAPVQAWAAPDGQADGDAPKRVSDGIYCGDVRVASSMVLGSSSHEIEHVSTEEPGGGRASHTYVLRTPELGVDPALVLRRFREADPTGVTERLELTTASLQPLDVALSVRVRPDATGMQEIKSGAPAHPITPSEVTGSKAVWHWRDDRTTATLTTDGTLSVDGDAHVVGWQATVPARGRLVLTWRLEATDTGAGFEASPDEPLVAPAVEGDRALQALLDKSFADINALRMAVPGRERSTFLAAGAPWYLTLFGRDSLISAMNLLPHDLTVPVGTLRVLAGLQGTKSDPDSAEQPGKILHEVRQEPLELDLAHMGQTDGHISLPPLYYGTIDATCLWVMLLDRAELAGLDETSVRDLLPALRAALGWITDSGDADGDGFLEYIDETGHGLANQGWKDSGDSVRFADGTQAVGPVALCEVQGYAHAALLAGARLLEKYEDDAEASTALRDRAALVAERFRAQFWATDELGSYPVLALDGEKKQVDGVASNMGHLLRTGICSAAEETVIVERLMDPSMRSGYGIRTLSTDNGGYWPLGYHVGSVWTHDTAFIIDGMLRTGHTDEAAVLAHEILHAAQGFANRLPELYSGVSSDEIFPPAPYPAACRPQAWAATSAMVVARALA